MPQPEIDLDGKTIADLLKGSKTPAERIPLLQYLLNEVLEESKEGEPKGYKVRKKKFSEHVHELGQDVPKEPKQEAGKLPESQPSFSKDEINSRYVSNPLLGAYEESVTAIPKGDRYKDHDKIKQNVESIGDFPENRRKYRNAYDEDVLRKLRKDTKKLFEEEMIPSIYRKHIKAGTFGSATQSRDLARALEKSQEVYQDKASELLNRAYQQSAQLYNADRGATMQKAEILSNLDSTKRKNKLVDEAAREEKANKVQHERQQQLAHTYARHREEQERPKQEVANVLAMLGENGKEYQGTGDFSPFMPEQKSVPQLYNKGGKVKAQAKNLAKMGRNGDTMLAHINPAEAALLKAYGGSGTINPKTGLREYGFFQNGFKGWGRAFQPRNWGREFLRNILPVGTFMLTGNPMLVGAASGIGNKLSGEDWGTSLGRGLGAGALAYGVQGLGQAAGLGKFGYGFGGDPNMIATGLGKMGIGAMTPANAATAALNASSAPIALATPAASSAAGVAGVAGEKAAEGTLASILAHPGVDLAVKAAPIGIAGFAAYGQHNQAKEAQKMMKEQQEKEEAAIKEILRRQDLTEAEKKEELRKKGIEDKEQIEKLLKFSINRSNDHKYKRGGIVKKYAKGGYVEGDDSGIDDKFYVSIPEGAYVLNANDLSLLGDGNSLNGKKKIEERLAKKSSPEIIAEGSVVNFEHDGNNRRKKAKVADELSRFNKKMVDAVVSAGEFILTPEDVLSFTGKETVDDGAKALDKFRKNLKRHKGVNVKKTILPETKTLSFYM